MSTRKPSRALQGSVWNKYIKDTNTAECYVGCGRRITPFDFECGHDIANALGGDLSVTNLRPVCSLCNKSMQKKTFSEFRKENKYVCPYDNKGNLMVKNKSDDKDKIIKKFNKIVNTDDYVSVLHRITSLEELDSIIIRVEKLIKNKIMCDFILPIKYDERIFDKSHDIIDGWNNLLFEMCYYFEHYETECMGLNKNDSYFMHDEQMADFCSLVIDHIYNLIKYVSRSHDVSIPLELSKGFALMYQLVLCKIKKWCTTIKLNYETQIDMWTRINNHLYDIMSSVGRYMVRKNYMIYMCVLSYYISQSTWYVNVSKWEKPDTIFNINVYLDFITQKIPYENISECINIQNIYDIPCAFCVKNETSLYENTYYEMKCLETIEMFINQMFQNELYLMNAIKTFENIN
jgi:hypothetical protein